MIARGVTKSQMHEAISNASARYDDNVIFKNFEERGRGFSFTLTVKKAAEPGGKRSNTGRRISAACWHVHRDFMREIFKLNPDAIISSNFIRYDGSDDFEASHDDTGDRNVGSLAAPLLYRNACACGGGRFGPHVKVHFV